MNNFDDYKDIFEIDLEKDDFGPNFPEVIYDESFEDYMN